MAAQRTGQSGAGQGRQQQGPTPQANTLDLPEYTTKEDPRPGNGAGNDIHYNRAEHVHARARSHARRHAHTPARLGLDILGLPLLPTV